MCWKSELSQLQVFPSKKFCRYNMLNHHFFGGEKDLQTFNNFLSKDSGKQVAMVIDPPFGIMVEALCDTINKIQAVWKSQSPGRIYTHKGFSVYASVIRHNVKWHYYNGTFCLSVYPCNCLPISQLVDTWGPFYSQL